MAEDQSRLIVDAESSGKRLDLFLVRHRPDLSRSRWKELIAGGQILVNGKPAAKQLQLQAGWTITLPAPPMASSLTDGLANSELASRIPVLLNDPDFLAVDKPAGLPTHPLRATERDTLFNALIAIDPGIASAGPKPLEGGLVHRLDIQTSGVVLAARTPAGFAGLQERFSGHLAEKTYIALVVGLLRSDIDVTSPIAHHARKSSRMVAISPDLPPSKSHFWRGNPRPATTRIHILQVLAGHTLVEVSVLQAQMHQIRVHLHAIGHPLAGDAIYKLTPAAQALPTGITRHALHAWRISLPHPITGLPLRIEAPLPPDMQTAISQLGGIWPL